MKIFKFILITLVALCAPVLGLAADVPPFHPIANNQGVIASFGVTGNQYTQAQVDALANGDHTFPVVAADGITPLGSIKINVTGDTNNGNHKSYTFVSFTPAP